MQMKMTIHNELSRFAYCEYLNSLEANQLAYWLVHSFSPERYRNPDDVIEFAIRLLFFKTKQPELIKEFVGKLWGMFGLEPDPADYLQSAEVLPFRKLH
jgi:hypothetical protein